MSAAFVAGCALLGAAAGVLVPAWVARLPAPYADLAGWRPLRAVAAAVLAGLWGAAGARLGPDPVVAAACYLLLVGVVVGYTDLRLHLLPNAVVLPSYAVLGVLLVIAAATSGAWVDLAWAAAGGAVLGAFFGLLLLVHPAGMGFGDVKLAGLLGVGLGRLGFGHLALCAFTAFALGGLTGLALVLLRRAGRRTAIPFGPFLLAGFAVSLLFGGPIVDWYTGARA